MKTIELTYEQRDALKESIRLHRRKILNMIRDGGFWDEMEEKQYMERLTLLGQITDKLER